VEIGHLLFVTLSSVLIRLDLLRGKGLVLAHACRLEILDEALVALGAVLLPLAEEVEGQGAQQGAELSVGTLFIFVQNHIGLENASKVHPELIWTAQSLIVQQVLQLGHVDDLQGLLAKQAFNLISLVFQLFLIEGANKQKDNSVN